MSKLLARYDDFTKGDAGWVDKSKVQAGFFLGENVVPYRDGSIGPRSGRLDLSAIGPPSGTVHQIGYVDLAGPGNEYVWLHKGTHLARIPVYNVSGLTLTAQSYVLATGSFAIDADGDSVDYDAAHTLFVVVDDKCYSCDWGAGAGGTLTALAGSPGGACMELFANCLVVGNLTSHPNRIAFSKPSDFSTWPAKNFVDLSEGGAAAGAAPRIRAMKRVKDTLLVWTDLGQLFSITGTLGENEVIREFMHGDQVAGPAGPYSVARARDGTAWWTRREEVPNSAGPVYGAPSAMPVFYNAGNRDETPEMSGYLQQPFYSSARASFTFAVAGRSNSSVLLMDETGRVLMLRHGVWSRHFFTGQDRYRCTVGSRGEVFFVNSDGSTLSVWQFELERPPWRASGGPLPYTIEQFAPAGAGECWVATPEYRPQDFGVARVSSIEVMFTSHNVDDAADNNYFEVYLQQYDGPAAVEIIDDSSNFPPDRDDTAGAMTDNVLVTGGSDVLSTGTTIGMTNNFDEMSPTAVDLRRRVTFFPAGQAPRPTPGLRVFLRGLRGVSIHEILVFGDLESVTRP